MDNKPILFTEQEISLFAEASQDRNPLHNDPVYARTTPFGQQVVFGMLGALKCLAALRPPPNQHPKTVTIQFRSPMLLNTPYTLVQKKEHEAVVTDGTRTLLHIAIQFADGPPIHQPPPETPAREAESPAQYTQADIATAHPVLCPYLLRAEPYQHLLTHLQLDPTLWGSQLLTTLLASSYAVGMHIPGENALFFSARINLQKPRQTKGQTNLKLELTDYDDRMNRAILNLEITDEKGQVASAELQAFVRLTHSTTLTVPQLDSTQARVLEGKTALIVGASRGLGAALALSLTARGAKVIGAYTRSNADAQQLAKAAEPLSGQLTLIKADCANPDHYAQIDVSHLDILICSAAPSIAALRLEPESADRILAYIQNGLDLVCRPLCAWLPKLKASEGVLLYISSSAVEQPVVRWPHYVAMKSAAEGLVRTAALQFPAIKTIIARPGKIRTDLINTPLASYNAEDPADVAERLVAHILEPTAERTRYVS